MSDSGRSSSGFNLLQLYDIVTLESTSQCFTCMNGGAHKHANFDDELDINGFDVAVMLRTTCKDDECAMQLMHRVILDLEYETRY